MITATIKTETGRRVPQDTVSQGTPALTVENLKTHFFTKAGVVKAVDDVSFTVGRGEILGLVGESGSGKTVTGFSILGLVDAPGRIVGGRVLFNGEDIAGYGDDRMRRIRGRKIAMIFQDPMMTLNPVLRIDTQMIEAIQAHEAVSRAEALRRARDALGQVGIASPEERLHRSEEHTSELQSLMRISYAVFCLKKKKQRNVKQKQKPNKE